MSDSFKAIVIEVVKVSLVVWTVLVVAPLLASWFPHLPELASYATTTLLGALVLEVVWVFLFFRPQLAVTWTKDDDPDTQSNLDVIIDRSTRESVSVFNVTVQGVRVTGLGRLIMYIALKHGLILKVVAPNANLLFILDDFNTGSNNQPLARSALEACGVELMIPSPYTKGAMNYAAVRVRSRGGERRSDYEIRHEKSASRGIGAICASLVHVDAKVVTMRERWS